MNPDEIDVMKLTPEDYLKMRERCKELERDNILQHEHILELERANSELSGTIRRMHGGCERAVELRKLLDELFDVGRNEVVSDDEIRKRMKNLQNELAQLRKENCRVYNQRNQLADEKKQQAAYILELRTELERVRRAANKSAERIELLNNFIGQLQREIAKGNEEIQDWTDKTHKLQEFISTMVTTNDAEASEAALKDADAKIQSANDRAANAKKEAKEAKERAENASERVRYLERKLRDVGSLNDSLMKELARRQGCNMVSVDLENAADAYQKSVMRYASPAVEKGCPLSLLYGVVGMCGEAGEASELVKKNAFHGHTLDCKHLASELGDVLWYIAYTADDLGYPLSAIMAMNQEKLAKRYPDGKFDAERSRHREEGDI